jgi:prepilin-type N-terminal cleavage/methylation domain-containing protein
VIGARPRRGFTLLEVMISLAILAVSLVAIADLNGGAVQMHAYSRRATQATLLLRGKMLDVEDDLQKNGFSDFNDEKHGDFSDDGAAEYSWSAEILKPDIQLDPTQLLNLLTGGQGGLAGATTSLAQAFGTAAPTSQQQYGAPGSGQQQGAPQGGLVGGPLGGAVSTQMTTFVETLKKSVREVRLAVRWKDGKYEQQVEASQIIVILPETVGATPEGFTNTVQQQQNPITGATQLVPQPNAPPSSDPGTAR